MLKLMETLCSVDGVSGYEYDVRKTIEDMITPHVEEMMVDAMASLIAFKKGRRPPGRRLMICAHTDEVGMLIFRITDEGLLKFVPVGALDPRVLLGQRVRIGKRRLPGVVAIKALRLTSEAEKKNLRPSKRYISISALGAKMKPLCTSVSEIRSCSTTKRVFSARIVFGQRRSTIVSAVPSWLS